MDHQHHLRLVANDANGTEPPRVEPTSRLGLTWLDKMATTALIECDATEVAELVELVRGCA